MSCIDISVLHKELWSCSECPHMHLENGVIEDLSHQSKHPEEKDYMMSNDLLINNSPPKKKIKVTLRSKKSVIVESPLLD